MGWEGGGAGELRERARDAQRPAARELALVMRQVQRRPLRRAEADEYLFDHLTRKRLGRRRTVECIGVQKPFGDGVDPGARLFSRRSRDLHAARTILAARSGERL